MAVRELALFAKIGAEDRARGAYALLSEGGTS